MLARVIVLFFAMLSSVHGEEGVVLLHGLGRTSASMAKLERALASQGYVVVNHEYASRSLPIDLLSPVVVGEALAHQRLSGCSKVHFVTHSLGGILVRHYFAGRKEERLGRVVMLGPPNQGSEVVDHLKGWWVFRKLTGPAGAELSTRENSIPQQLGPVFFDLGVVAGDRSINWINNGMIPGRDDGKVSVEKTKVEGMKDHVIVHATHPFMMKNARVIKSAIAFLETGSFETRRTSFPTPNQGLKIWL